MRVFDCILFNQEHDMLECRLSEIGDVVDKIIIVESATTFMGQPKAHGIDLDRFYKWRDKIHYEIYEPDASLRSWSAETEQRNHLFTVLRQFAPEAEDIVTVADCDEIWSPNDIETLKTGWHGYMMKRLVMSAYWRLSDEHTMVAGPWGQRSSDAQSMRSARYKLPELRSGWHVSWMGGPEWAANKMRSFSHQELMVENPDAFMAENYRVGRSIRGEELIEVSMDDSWIPWISEGKAPLSWYRRR
jgi:hypothetical protein